jgi:hypothetical protein
MRIHFLNLELALASSEALIVEKEAFTPSFRVKAFNSASLITFRINLNVTHHIGPGLNNGRDIFAEVQDHLGSGIAESVSELPHEHISLSTCLGPVSFTEVFKILDDIFDLILVDLNIEGKFIIRSGDWIH